MDEAGESVCATRIYRDRHIGRQPRLLGTVLAARTYASYRFDVICIGSAGRKKTRNVSCGRGQECDDWSCGGMTLYLHIFSGNGTYVKDGFTSFLPGIPGALGS